MEIRINKEYGKKLLSIILVSLLIMSCTNHGLVGFAATIDNLYQSVKENFATNGNVSVDSDWDVIEPQNRILIDGVYYYEISTAEELAYIAAVGGNWCQYNYILTNDIILNDQELTYNEQGDITVDTTKLKKWIPFSLYSDSTFDGNGFTIFGAYIDESSYSSGYTAFFKNGNIKNLNLENAYIIGCGFVGGISVRGNVANCTYSGAVVNILDSDNVYVGSGTNVATGSMVAYYGYATDCINYGDVFGEYVVGGVAGYVEYYDNRTITNCVNYGNINGTKYVGGICAYGYATSSVNYGNVNGTDYVGGISGQGDATSSTNYGNVSGANYVGGITGRSYGSSDLKNYGDVTGIDYVGGISGQGDATSSTNYGNVSGANYVGGITGCSYESSNLKNFGNVTGVDYVGGIIGRCYNGSNYDENLSNLSNSGNVSGSNYVGGLIGYFAYCSLDSGYSIGKVQGDTNVGALIGCSDSVWGRGKVSNLNYYKDNEINKNLYGFGNCNEDFENVTTQQPMEFFCIDDDGYSYGIHSESEWLMDPEKECGEPNSKYKKCINCGEILKTGKVRHVSSVWIVDEYATETTDGLRHLECKSCGRLLESDVLYKENYYVPTEKVVAAINRATMYASQESYDWSKRSYFQDVYSSYLSADAIVDGELLSLVDGDAIHTGTVKNGEFTEQAIDDKHLLKDLQLHANDISWVQSSKNGEEITYTLEGVSSEVINDKITSEYFNQNFATAVFGVSSEMIKDVSSNIDYHNIVLKATIEKGYLKNLQLTYNMYIYCSFKYLILNMDMSSSVTVTENYSNFEYKTEVDHEFSEWEMEFYPTCSQKGEEFRECLYCDEIEYRELPINPTAHWYYGDVCTICGHSNVILNGWVEENSKWAYYENGVKITNTWKADSMGWCYLGADGYMLTNKWVMDSKGWCYVGSNGYCVTNQWVADSKGWCYLGADGRMVTNKWVADSKGWCYVGADGYCVTNKWVADSKGWCYLGADGRMVTNKWVKDSKGWCYIGADGYCVTNKWVKDSTGWCYLDASGRMVVNNWVQDGGKWYYLDNNGYMVTGTKTIGGKTYKFASNGVWIA